MEGCEGFFFLFSLDGIVDSVKMIYIICDYDCDKFEVCKWLFMVVVDWLNLVDGVVWIKVDMKDQYYNMCEIIEKDMWVVELVK